MLHSPQARACWVDHLGIDPVLETLANDVSALARWMIRAWAFYPARAMREDTSESSSALDVDAGHLESV